MLFGHIIKGSYDFLGGSQVFVSTKSYQSILSSLLLERGKMGVCGLLEFVLEHSTLFTSDLTMAFIIFSAYICIYTYP